MVRENQADNSGNEKGKRPVDSSLKRREYLKVGGVSAAAAVGVGSITSTAAAAPEKLSDPAPSDSLVGGGRPYYEASSANRVTRSEADTVLTTSDSVSDLEAALSRSGETVYLEGDVEMDLTVAKNIDIAQGVTLASDRGRNDNSGALLYYTDVFGNPYDSVFKTTNGDIRITGFRFEGPRTDYFDRSDYESYLTEGFHFVGVSDQSNAPEIEVDNCQMFGWTTTAISVGHYSDGGSCCPPDETLYANADVHHCSMHNNQMEAYGYAVNLFDGHVDVAYCYFARNRHSIDGYGWGTSSYEAHHNIVESTISHAFDMHRLGQNYRDEGNGGWTAGGTIDVHDNQFRFKDDELGRHQEGVTIRGYPADRVDIYDNQFAHDERPDDTNVHAQGQAFRQEHRDGEDYWHDLHFWGNEFGVTNWDDIGGGGGETPGTADIQVTVTDTDGNPLEGVSISGEGEEHPSDIPTEFGGETDENGTYTNVIYENDYEIVVSHPYYDDETVDHVHDSDSQIDVQLEPGVSEITVEVIDSNGNGVEGAVVEGEAADHPSGLPTEFSGETDENGVYTNVIFQNDYEISVSHPSYDGGTVDHAHYGDSQVAVQLEPDVSEVTVEVIDSNDNWIEGAAVEGEAANHPSGLPTEFSGETDENGTYTNVIYENDYEIAVSHPYYDDETVDYAHYGDSQIDVQLEPGVSEITVEVIDSNGNGVEGAVVEGEAADHPSDLPTEFSGETDENGVYTNVIFQNDYEISVSHPSYDDGTVDHAHYGDSQVAVTLEGM